MDYAKTLMMENFFSLKYWREVVSTTIYTLNRVQIRKGKNATPFELWYGHSPNVKNFKVFGCKFYILKDSKNGKFDAKSDEGIFLGYSTKSKAYKCLNTNTNKIVKSENMNFDEYTKDHDVEPMKNYKNTNHLYTSMKECLLKKKLPIKLGTNNKFY